MINAAQAELDVVFYSLSQVYDNSLQQFLTHLTIVT